MNEDKDIMYHIFYNGTTNSSYQEASHVLSTNNCVLIQDLLETLSMNGKKDACIAGNSNDYTGLDDVEDPFNLENPCFIENILSPTKD